MIVYLSTFLGIVAICPSRAPSACCLRPFPRTASASIPCSGSLDGHSPAGHVSGFASLSVPFAFAIAALWKKRWDGWARAGHPVGPLHVPDSRHGHPHGRVLEPTKRWDGAATGAGTRWRTPASFPGSAPPPWFTECFCSARRRHRRVRSDLACFAFATILYGVSYAVGILADFSVHFLHRSGVQGGPGRNPPVFRAPLDRHARLSLAVDPDGR
jgi:hypothetical protein